MQRPPPAWWWRRHPAEQVADEARQVVLGRGQERLQLGALRRRVPSYSRIIARTLVRCSGTPSGVSRSASIAGATLALM